MSFPSPTPREAADAPAGAPIEARQWLSALADGDPEAVSPALARWREDPAARADWHLYHLIGDVLRSEDLASTPGRDALFLARLRGELARQPVPLAPAALPEAAPARGSRRLGWRAPAAVAAGFVAVAATLVVVRPGGLGLEGTQLATPGGKGPVTAAGAGPSRAGVPAPPAGGPLIAREGVLRDPRLDEYLQAHQAARGGAPAALPFGGLRNAEVVMVPAMPSAGGAAAATTLSPANAASALRPASEAR